MHYTPGSVPLSNTCHGQDGSKVVYWPLIGDGDHSRKKSERFGRMKAHGTAMWDFQYLIGAGFCLVLSISIESEWSF